MSIINMNGIGVSQKDAINLLCEAVHEANKTWWHDPATGLPLKRNVGEMLMLVVSEIAEAMEGHRKNLKDDKLPHRSMIEVELADAVIRIFDISAGLGLDLGGAFIEKMAYNALRADHKPEARLAEGGEKSIKTKFQLHCEKWGQGCGSEYCPLSMHRVFYKGQIPCDILLVGEAPGKIENVRGIPFTGQAGKLLDIIVARSIDKTKYQVGFTNVVGCIARLEDEEKSTDPDGDQIALCKPRLEEIIDIANPRLIFAVGSVARDALVQNYMHSTKLPMHRGTEPTVVHIVHPAFILRQTIAFQGVEVQRVCCTIKDAIYAMERPKSRTLECNKLNTSTPNSVTMNDELPF